MFRLTIELPPRITVQTHPNRELARAELLDCLTAAGLPYRTAAASWAYTSYTITARGRAVIEEICGCEHTEDEHHRQRLYLHVLRTRSSSRLSMPALRTGTRRSHPLRR